MIWLLFPGIFLILVIWHFYFKKFWSKNVSVQLNFKEHYVYAGEQAHMTEQIENRKRLPLPATEIGFSISKYLVFQNMENASISDYTYKQDIYALSGFQRITRPMTIDCKKRGYYDVHEIDCRAFTLFYKFFYSTQFKADTNLYVYAKRTNVNGITAACEQMMSEQTCRRQLYEDPFAFSSIREYAITDPMRAINWKASAKSGQLMVNTFESTLNPKLMIYLDLTDEGIYKLSYLVEEGISIAATLAQKMLRHGVETGIAVQDKLFKPATGQHQLTCIEEMLACLDISVADVDFSLILSQPPRDCVSIVISKNTSAKNQSAIEAFLKKYPGIWVLPEEKDTKVVLTDCSNIQIIRREVARS